MAKPPAKKTGIEAVVTWIGSIQSIIVHTIIFLLFTLAAIFDAAQQNFILLLFNTVVSLEAIYLALFIQFTVNTHTTSLREVEEDIDEIQEDVEGLGEDVDEIQEDIEEISEDIEEISEDDEEDEKMHKEYASNVDRLTDDIRRVLDELEALKKKG